MFKRFLEWKVLVGKATGRKLKALYTDNGSEYRSVEFEAYLKKVRYELTVPKIQCQVLKQYTFHFISLSCNEVSVQDTY